MFENLTNVPEWVIIKNAFGTTRVAKAKKDDCISDYAIALMEGHVVVRRETEKALLISWDTINIVNDDRLNFCNQFWCAKSLLK